jgi:hypothetical protein
MEWGRKEERGRGRERERKRGREEKRELGKMVILRETDREKWWVRDRKREEKRKEEKGRDKVKWDMVIH